MWGSTARVRRPCRPPTSPGTSTSSRWVINHCVNKSRWQRTFEHLFSFRFLRSKSLLSPFKTQLSPEERWISQPWSEGLIVSDHNSDSQGRVGAAKQYFLFQLELNKLLREFYIQELNHSSPAPSVLWNHVAQNSFLIRVVYQMLHTATLGLSHKMIASNYRGGEVNENQTSHSFYFHFFEASTLSPLGKDSLCCLHLLGVLPGSWGGAP